MLGWAQGMVFDIVEVKIFDLDDGKRSGGCCLHDFPMAAFVWTDSD
jgi:hypothetical protein